MSTKSRRRFTPEFKSRVALEAIRGVKTVREIAAEYGVHPVQVSQWKRVAQEGLVGVFEKPRRRDEQAVEKERARLERKIGQLTMEVEFLKKSSARLGRTNV